MIIEEMKFTNKELKIMLEHISRNFEMMGDIDDDEKVYRTEKERLISYATIMKKLIMKLEISANEITIDNFK